MLTYTLSVSTWYLQHDQEMPARPATVCLRTVFMVWLGLLLSLAVTLAIFPVATENTLQQTIASVLASQHNLFSRVMGPELPDESLSAAKPGESSREPSASSKASLLDHAPTPKKVVVTPEAAKFKKKTTEQRVKDKADQPKTTHPKMLKEKAEKAKNIRAKMQQKGQEMWDGTRLTRRHIVDQTLACHRLLPDALWEPRCRAPFPEQAYEKIISCQKSVLLNIVELMRFREDAIQFAETTLWGLKSQEKYHRLLNLHLQVFHELCLSFHFRTAFPGDFAHVSRQFTVFLRLFEKVEPKKISTPWIYVAVCANIRALQARLTELMELSRRLFCLDRTFRVFEVIDWPTHSRKPSLSGAGVSHLSTTPESTACSPSALGLLNFARRSISPSREHSMEHKTKPPDVPPTSFEWSNRSAEANALLQATDPAVAQPEHMLPAHRMRLHVVENPDSS
eukprot:gb/GEZN01002360.1/.p1 GENE.gb/GEZN01002360.1/~~gb/GEZN01002360.1/.p1  ORF type:complete len:452 (-),score=72.07 gb/GEZN01002360.1/:54-1409(-)